MDPAGITAVLNVLWTLALAPMLVVLLLGMLASWVRR